MKAGFKIIAHSSQRIKIALKDRMIDHDRLYCKY